MSGRRFASCLVVVALGCAGGASREAPYVPDRHEYAAFRAAHAAVLDPNYLPFLAHRLKVAGESRDALVLCRWADDAMPLPVYVAPPEIDDALQNEFDPRPPEGYVASVSRALATWEHHLEGLVRFRRVERPEEAKLRIVLHGERAPVAGDEVTVLGKTRMANACVASGWDPDSDRLRVEFSVPSLEIYLADSFGLLSADQVEWITLHELGHALGMRGHSPIPADLMYEVVRDRMTVAEGLSTQDLNSFLSLYRLPNGTVFARVPEDGKEADLRSFPPTGPPRLALAPHVDPRLGFSVQPPRGWLTLTTRQGMLAVDGQTWDYTASFQIVASRFPSIDAYLERYSAYYLRRGRVVHTEELVVNGRRAVQGLLVRGGPRGPIAEEITLIEGRDGRVWVATADCPLEDLPGFHPWFDAALGSLEIWDGGP